MDTQHKLGWIAKYMLKTKPGFLWMIGAVMLVSGYFRSNSDLTNLGCALIIFGIIVAILIEVQVWAWKKADERHNGAFSKVGFFLARAQILRQPSKISIYLKTYNFALS
jgi:hypothetical protein